MNTTTLLIIIICGMFAIYSIINMYCMIYEHNYDPFRVAMKSMKRFRVKCKYIKINGFLIKDLVDKKYTDMAFDKIGFNRYIWKNGNEILGINLSKKEVQVIQELEYQLRVLQKENKDE